MTFDQKTSRVEPGQVFFSTDGKDWIMKVVLGTRGLGSNGFDYTIVRYVVVQTTYPWSHEIVGQVWECPEPDFVRQNFLVSLDDCATIPGVPRDPPAGRSRGLT